MSLDKAIKYGKEHRKEYRKAKRVDKACRNHGSCPYCRDNRTHKNRVREIKCLDINFFTECSNDKEIEIEPCSIENIINKSLQDLK